jgi:head-tail adaptor
MKLILHVEERTVGNELAGEPAESWARVRREFFDIEPLTGREYVQAQQMQSNVSHKMTSPWFPGYSSRQRLTRGDDKNNPERVFNVASVVNVGENNRQLEWMCQEAV